MKRLIIVGGGGAGRDVLEIAMDINALESRWSEIAIIDDALPRIDLLTRGEYRCIGTISGYQPEAYDEFAIGIGDPVAKKKTVELLVARGARFIQLIHPTVRVSRYAELGEGCVIFPYAYVGPNARIGKFLFLMKTSIGHDAVIGDYVTISSLCGISGNVTLGSGVFLGHNATIVPGMTVGKDAFIGAGSVVIRNIKEGERVFGNPVRTMPA
jgi:sugar O-acyltransferase (sialic acid O-acetyltransferase NeuD family)